MIPRRATGHPDLSACPCSPRAPPPSAVPRTARRSCRPPATSRPAVRPRGSRARLQAGKVPRARPRVCVGGRGGCCRRLCGKELGARSPPGPRRPPPRGGTPGSRAALGCWREVRGLRGRARTLRASGRPLRAEPSWEGAQGPSPETPSPRREHAARPPVRRARWRGRERRGQCLLSLTKGSRSPSPAERPAALRPASPSRQRRARPHAPGLRAAGSGRGAGPRGTGRGAGACSRAPRLQSPSLQPGSCRTREQQVAEDTGARPPPAEPPAAAGAAPGPPRLSRAPLRSGCAFCLHARGHTVT